MTLKQQTILVVDDETTIREVVRKYLERENFKVVEAETGPQAMDFLQSHQPDLIVLDIMLPGLDGFAITRLLRQATTADEIPIIMLTARTEEIDRVAGFEVGADDYVVKPFSPRELIGRIKAVLRRSNPGLSSAEKPLSFANFRLDSRSHTLNMGNAPIELTAKEFDLLWFLVSHANQVFSRSQLLDNIWGYNFNGDESTVTVHIRRLREKIEPDSAHPTYIQTIWGVGYKFEAS